MFTLIFAAEVLGEEVTDPKLKGLIWVSFLLIFAGMWALSLCRGMVDEARVRAEPKIASLFGRSFPPKRILTDRGQKFQTTAWVLFVLGAMVLVYIKIANG